MGVRSGSRHARGALWPVRLVTQARLLSAFRLNGPGRAVTLRRSSACRRVERSRSSEIASPSSCRSISLLPAPDRLHWVALLIDLG